MRSRGTPHRSSRRQRRNHRLQRRDGNVDHDDPDPGAGERGGYWRRRHPNHPPLDSSADLDLHVLDPASKDAPGIEYGSGGMLDHDANADCNGTEDDDNAVENVFWAPRSAPEGGYSAWVQVYKECDGPLDWHLTVRRNRT